MADAAVSEVRLGRGREALTRLADCLERLDELEPSSDLGHAYVQHLVRHAVSWTFGELCGAAVTTPDGPIRIEPGMCGVAEPATDLRAAPLAPLAECWCLLAAAEAECDLDAGIDRRLPEHVLDQMGPGGEVRLRLARMSRALRRCDVDAYVEALAAWIGAHHWIELRSPAVRGEAAAGSRDRSQAPLRGVTVEEWSQPGPRRALLASLEAFAVVAATTGRVGRLDELEGRLRALVEDQALLREVASRIAVSKAIEGVPCDLAEAVALMRPDRPRDPIDSMRVSIRLLQAASQVFGLGLGKVVGRPLADWIGAEWSRSATRQAFSLVAPSRSAPAILAVVASSTGDVPSAARIVEAALPAVPANVPSGIRAFVAAMAGRREHRPRDVGP